MPGLCGLEVARAASDQCHIVFVTGYSQYAVAAFEQDAVDYVLKPFDAARLVITVDRLRERLLSPPADLSELLHRLPGITKQRGYLRWINASMGKGVKLVTVDEICYFQASNKYTSVVTAHSDLLIIKSIKELSDELDPQIFFRIHRSTIVNLNAIEKVERNARGGVLIKLKQREESLRVAEAYVHLFRRM